MAEELIEIPLTINAAANRDRMKKLWDSEQQLSLVM